MSDAERRTAALQLDAAAQDLAARNKGDYTVAQIREALERMAAYVMPMSVRRMKWLKILTLWHLYPAASPDKVVLTAPLTDTGRHQDDRMRDALELPLPEAARS
ncbi:MAG: hypothetical protein MK180_00940 [Rhodobacteraceae bacterium]|nr:hypothetical protein [Paracoccaceae bacterium]